jgi:hypothetical protein
MSRVEEEREAALLAARLAEQRRNEEVQRTKRASENAKFGRLVQEQRVAAKDVKERSLAQSAIAQAMEDAESAEVDGERTTSAVRQGETEEGKGRLARGQAALAGKAKEATRDDSTRMDGSHRVDAEADGVAAAGRESDAAVHGRGAEGRRADARTGRELLERRRAEADASSQVGPAAPRGGEPKTERDGRGGQGGGADSGKDGSSGGGGGASFRFNPALMAPTPVIQKKGDSGSERLRKVANELAQKIVERVRVGTNALGRAEFQIDLRQNVLSGLSVKVSAQHGRIRAVFSGSDKEVLKLVEQQAEMLKGALAGRGLTLEDLKIEART